MDAALKHVNTLSRSCLGKYGRCSAIVYGSDRYCPACKPLHEKLKSEFEKNRESASKRGYGRKWEKARIFYLRHHPLCVECLGQGKTTRATQVHHIIAHKGNWKLFWDSTNWASLCHSCHSQLTAKGL